MLSFHRFCLVFGFLFFIIHGLFAQDNSIPVLREAERELRRIETADFPKVEPNRAPNPDAIPYDRSSRSAMAAIKSNRHIDLQRFAHSHVGLSFDDLWSITLQNNPVLRQKGSLITAASGAQLQAGLKPNPTLNYAGDNLGVGSTAGKQGMGLSQELVTAGKKRLARSVASYDVEAAKQEYAMACQRLRNDLKIAVAEVLHAQFVLQIERFSERLSDDLLRSAEQLQKKGQARSIDILQFRTTLNESALQIKMAENNQRMVWQQLVSMVGVPDMPLQAVSGSLMHESTRRDWDTTWNQFQAQSPQLELACLRVRQARMNLEKEKAERVPNVFANVMVSRDIPGDANVPLVGISVPLKIYDRNQGNICKAQAEIAVAQREVDRIALGLHARLAIVFRDYINSQELVETYERNILPDTFEALSQMDELYQKGDVNYLELYTQRHAIMETLLRYVGALKMQKVSATLIDGMLLEGTLD